MAHSFGVLRLVVAFSTLNPYQSTKSGDKAPHSKVFTSIQTEAYNARHTIHLTEAIVNQGMTQPMAVITATELKQRIDNGDDIQIIDVREQNEYDYARIPNSTLIPLGQVLSRMSEIDPARETVVHCKMGGRSAKAIEILKHAGFSGSLANLAGGIMAWSNEVDPSVPKY